MNKLGVIIGYCKSHKSKLIKCRELNRSQGSNIQVKKTKGFISNHINVIQDSLNQILIAIKSLDKIYLVLRYERLDLMKTNFNAIIQYFKEYKVHICLIVTNFIVSDKKSQNIQKLYDELIVPHELSEFAIYILSTNRESDILETYQGDKYIGQDISRFFSQSLQNSKNFELDSKIMGLQKLLDAEILKQLFQITNTNSNRNKTFEILDNQSKQVIMNPINMVSEQIVNKEPQRGSIGQQQFYNKNNQQQKQENQQQDSIFTTIIKVFKNLCK